MITNRYAIGGEVRPSGGTCSRLCVWWTQPWPPGWREGPTSRRGAGNWRCTGLPDPPAAGTGRGKGLVDELMYSYGSCWTLFGIEWINLTPIAQFWTTTYAARGWFKLNNARVTTKTWRRMIEIIGIVKFVKLCKAFLISDNNVNWCHQSPLYRTSYRTISMPTSNQSERTIQLKWAGSRVWLNRTTTPLAGTPM